MKTTSIGLVLAAGLLGFVASAFATEYRLSGSPGTRVIVWRDAKAFSEGSRILRSDVDSKSKMRALMPLAACGPVVGTRFILSSDISLFNAVTTIPIVIIEGPEAGCRGVVPRGSFEKRP